MKVSLSVIKADVGSIGGHTKPSEKMLNLVRKKVRETIAKHHLLIDGFVSHTGDDIAIIMSHKLGVSNTKIHQFAWQKMGTVMLRRKHRHCEELATKQSRILQYTLNCFARCNDYNVII